MDGHLSVEESIAEIPLEDIAIFLYQFPMTMLFVVGPCSCVLVAVAPREGALSRLVAMVEMAVVHVTVMEFEQSRAGAFATDVVAVILITILEDVSSTPILQVMAP